MLPKAVEKEIKSLDNLRTAALELEEPARDAEQIVAAAGLAEDSRITLSIGVGLHVVQGALIHFDNPSKSDILTMRREMAGRGYKVASVSDEPDMRRRTYNCGQIKLMCFFWNFSGEPRACEYVQTGTKEVPTYELICEDGETVEAGA